MSKPPPQEDTLDPSLREKSNKLKQLDLFYRWLTFSLTALEVLSLNIMILMSSKIIAALLTQQVCYIHREPEKDGVKESKPEDCIPDLPENQEVISKLMRGGN